MSQSYFHSETKDGIALVQMTHGKANALDLELCTHLASEFDRIAQSAKAAVITGAGRIFSAGVDLVRLCEENEDYTRRFLPALDRLLLTMFQFPRPMVAAINGHAIAGGCIVACACDVRLMAEGAFKIGVPELAVGVPFPPSALEVLRYAATDRYVNELAAGAKIYSADEAAGAGLVHKLVPGERLVEIAMAEATRLAQLQSEAFSITKAMLRRPGVDRIHYLQAEYGKSVVEDWTRPATREAIRRYVSVNLNK